MENIVFEWPVANKKLLVESLTEHLPAGVFGEKGFVYEKTSCIHDTPGIFRQSGSSC